MLSVVKVSLMSAYIVVPKHSVIAVVCSRLVTRRRCHTKSCLFYIPSIKTLFKLIAMNVRQ